MDWLLAQAQSASPLFAVGALVALGVLWRQHVQDQRTIKAMGDQMNRSMVATARALTKMAGVINTNTRVNRMRS